MSKKAVLMLSDGTIFEGNAIGLIGTTTGEACFNTGMTGYQEIFTDPSYYGQILITTHTHIGNYGVIDSEMESSNAQISGLVVKNFSDHHSRQGSDGNLDDFLREQKVVGISGIDTRKLVRHIRDKGVMNALISSEELDVSELKESLEACPDMAGLELASRVTTSVPYEMGNPDHPRVAVLDYGVKKSILNCLVQRDFFIKVFPSSTRFEDFSEFKPDGVFLSNGPGDPSMMDDAVQLVKEVVKWGIPVFGICLGHQILCMAHGITTFKMQNGHRGINHPVKNISTGKSEITSQNHGFSVEMESAKNCKEIEISHININDNTLEGIKLLSGKGFSVQYHPEASPGPHDSRYLFDDFRQLVLRNIDR